MIYKLSEICIDGKGSYGIGAPAVPFDKDKYTYLRITDINDDGSLNFADLKSVDDENAENYVLKENDIVFARTGNSTGRSYFYQKNHGTFVYAGFLIKFSLDPTKVNPRILKYYTHSKTYYDWVRSFDTGGTRGNINAKTYGDMLIELPKRTVQDKIVNILSSLDAKIENNNKINANLEAQAAAIFKSWFVDFEPFRNGEFVESELGMIPKGWKVGTLGDIAQIRKISINPANFPDTEFSHYSLPAYDEKKFPQKQLGKDIKSSKFRFRNNSILVSKLNPEIKRIWYVYEQENNAICSTEFVPILPNLSRDFAFVYCCVKDEHHYAKLLGGVTGATNSHQRLHPDDILNLEIPINETWMGKFAILVLPMLTKINLNIKENQSLSSLRDTLLPKLMSGEIDLDKINLA